MSNKYELIEVEPKKVAYNPSNPRGETPEQIHEDPSFNQLVDSVFKYGVLVPVVIYKQDRGKKPFRLIDGERRLRAALKSSTPLIPAHVAKSGPTTDHLIQAFHIHMLRKQWSNTAQTRALKPIIKQFRKDKDLEGKELFVELLSFTGYTNSQLNSLMRGSKYSEDILKDVDSGRLAWSHLVQIEASFVEQLEQDYPGIIKYFGKRTIRKELINKAKRGVLSSTRALMNNIVPVINKAQTQEEKKYVESLLIQFVSDADEPAENVLQKFDKKFPSSQKDLLDILNNSVDTAEKLETLLNSLPVNQVLSYPTLAKELYRGLESLKKIMSKKQRTLKSILNG